MGRSSLDLYAREVGAPFPEIESFAAYVGGSPTNIAVGTARLGLKSALVTAVGEDPVGDFILRFLEQEGVVTSTVVRKPGRRSSAVVLGIEPPDRFPLVYYRDNCADIELTIDDVDAAREGALFQFAGTNLCKDPSRSATLWAAEQARAAGAQVAMDLDFRPDQWHDVRAFGVTVRSALRLVDVVLATEDELKAAMLSSRVEVAHSQQSGARVAGDTGAALEAILALGVKTVALKRGAEGATVYTADQVVDAPGYPVEVMNVLGAGDAFASGFLYGLRQGWEWRRSARLGNACGALVVTRHGCANFMPTMAEIDEFVASRGGL